MSSIFDLPKRCEKPRTKGLNILIDNGLPTQYFRDIVFSHSTLIDFVKFGWCTAIITKDIDEKIKALREADIQFFFGGTFFEKAVHQNKVDAFIDYIREKGSTHVEVSNGTIDLSPKEKARHISRLSEEFAVMSEVGFKDNERSREMHPARWVEEIIIDFEAGAEYVITESRESGRSGIARDNGEVRYGLINELLDCPKYENDKLIFEAPNKYLQNYFIKLIGPNVNLANVAFQDIVACETLRLGLRSDTLLHFQQNDR